MYLVLDQAEEHFVYHAGDDHLERELAEVVLRPLRANVLMIVRDDALARLDVFRALLPGVFANVVRLSPLDRAAAERAIVGPLRRYEELTGRHVEIEGALVDRVLAEVAVGEIDRGLGGSGAVDLPATDGIEAPYLQLVLERLWDEERAAGSETLRLATLERLGGARKIVGDHLERALQDLAPREQEIAAAMFAHLVTPSGTKIAHLPGDLAAFAGVSEADLRPILESLLARRILRSEERGQYAIYHDVLAAEVLGWCRRFEAERALATERRAAARRHRRLAALAGAAAVAAAVAVGLAVWALAERSNATEQSTSASARTLDASAAALLDSDPELSLLAGERGCAALAGPDDGGGAPQRPAGLRGARRLRSRRARRGDRRVAGREPDRRRRRRGRRARVGRGGRPCSREAGARSDAGVAFGLDRTVVLHGAAGAPIVVDRLGRTTCTLGSRPVADVVVAGDRAVLSDGRVLSIATCAPLGRIAGVGGAAARVVAAGSGGVVAFVRGATVTFARLPARTVVSRLRGERAVAALELDRAGRVAVVAFAGSADAAIWDVDRGAAAQTLSGHFDDVVAAAIDDHGTIAATGSLDGQARVWDVRSGEVDTVLSGHLNFVTAIDLTGDGEHVVTASPDPDGPRLDDDGDARLGAGGPRGRRHLGRVRRRRPAGAHRQRRRHGTAVGFRHRSRPAPLARAVAAAPTLEALSPDGAATARADGDVVTIVRGDGGRVTLVGHRRPVTSVAFSPDGRRLVTASKDNDAIVWDAASGRALRVLRAHFGPVFDARYSPDGRWIVTAGPTTAGLWNAGNGAFVRYLRGAPGPLAAAAFASGSRAVITVSRDGTVSRYPCEICGTTADLRALALARLAATGRALTAEERALYLG